MKGRRRTSAREVTDPKGKINPAVIRQLIFEIVEFEFGGDRGLAAKELKLVNPVKGNAKAFSKDSLANVIDDRTALKYSHLEAIANHYGVPTFMVLLFSRVRSEYEKSPGMNKREVSEVQYLIRFLQDIEAVIERSGFHALDLREWSQQYREGRLNL